MDKKGKVELYCDLDAVAAFSLAVDAKGVLFAGASPGGVIYRIKEKNKAKEFFKTEQEYVWDLLFDKDGNLFAATGTKGKLFKIKADAKGEIFYECPEKNIMDIMIMQKIKDDSIYIACQDKGRIYRVYEKDRAFVLLDSGFDEIRAIVEGEEGYFYAALNTSKTIAKPSIKSKNAPKDKTTGSDENGDEEKKIQLSMPRVLGEKSVILKLDMSGYVWTLLGTPESPIHSFIYDTKTKKPLAGIGEKGKLIRVDETNKYTVILSSEQKYILSLLELDNSLITGTGTEAGINRVNRDDLTKGEYISPVHDAKTAVLWGRIHIEGDIPKGCGIKVATRTGNTEEADKSWSEWSKNHSLKNNQIPVTSPVSRFLQYKLLLSGKSREKFPVVKKVSSYYLPPNRAPLIESINIVSGGKSKPRPKPSSKAKSSSKTNGSKSSNPANSVDAKANSNPKKVKITWKVNDPEKDKLEHTIYFKGEGETVWKEIEDKLSKASFDFSTSSLPDGRYSIKVKSSDLPGNPKTSSKEDELESDIFVIDNTPPKLLKDLSFDRVSKDAIVVNASIEDEASIISSAQYSVNAGDWFNIIPEDEIFDSQAEKFSFMIDEIKKEEILVTLMVTDSKGNTIVEKLLVKKK
jgi:hypothetical protein